MHLVDSSSWIHSLRPDGNADVRSRVERLLRGGEACWCPMVRLELWNGARGDREKRVLRDLEAQLPDLEITPQVWSRAYDVARRARQQGVTVPATDLLIAACAAEHGATVEHSDEHFEMIARL